jgi:hypothetical protein
MLSSPSHPSTLVEILTMITSMLQELSVEDLCHQILRTGQLKPAQVNHLMHLLNQGWCDEVDVRMLEHLMQALAHDKVSCA